MGIKRLHLASLEDLRRDYYICFERLIGMTKMFLGDKKENKLELYAYEIENNTIVEKQKFLLNYEEFNAWLREHYHI